MDEWIKKIAKEKRRKEESRQVVKKEETTKKVDEKKNGKRENEEKKNNNMQQEEKKIPKSNMMDKEKEGNKSKKEDTSVKDCQTQYEENRSGRQVHIQLLQAEIIDLSRQLQAEKGKNRQLREEVKKKTEKLQSIINEEREQKKYVTNKLVDTNKKHEAIKDELNRVVKKNEEEKRDKEKFHQEQLTNAERQHAMNSLNLLRAFHSQRKVIYKQKQKTVVY